MVGLTTLVPLFLALAQPVHAQSCDVSGLDGVARDLDTVLDEVAPVPEGSALDEATARTVSWIVDALEFELDTMLELVDVGHTKTAEVIGEVVLGELEQLREVVGMSDEDWATLVGLYAQVFDPQTLASPERTREAVDALMDEVGRHGSGTGWADSLED